jgi:hypothetical protein
MEEEEPLLFLDVEMRLVELVVVVSKLLLMIAEVLFEVADDDALMRCC